MANYTSWYFQLFPVGSVSQVAWVGAWMEQFGEGIRRKDWGEDTNGFKNRSSGPSPNLVTKSVWKGNCLLGGTGENVGYTQGVILGLKFKLYIMSCTCRFGVFIHEDHWEGPPARTNVGESQTLKKLWDSTETGLIQEFTLTDWRWYKCTFCYLTISQSQS